MMGNRQFLPFISGKPIFFVSPDGSDTNGDGTFENPWKTIGKGLSNPYSWNTLYIRGGTYVEQITINRSGTADAPILVAAYPGEKVVIDGEAGVDGLNEGLPDYGELIIPPGLRDEKGFRYTPLVWIKGNYVIFGGFDIKRSMGRGIQVSRDEADTRGVTIRNCKISASRKNGMMIEQRCKEIIIENCDISRSGNFAPYDRSSSELDWGGACVVKGSDNVIIRGTSIHENWGEGFITDSQTNNSTNIRVSKCIFFDNMRPSIYLHAVTNIIVEKNLLYHSINPEFPFGEGIAITPSEPQYEDDVDIENVTVANNIFVGMGSNIALYGQDGRMLRKIRVLFNTLVNAQNYGIMESSSHYEACELKNNVVYQSNGEVLVNGGADFRGWAVSGNAWYPERPSSVPGDRDVIGNPQFENPEAELLRGQVNPAWYKIKATSPVIDQAVTVPFIDRDFFDNIRDAQPDMGAHEFQKETLTADSPEAIIDDRSRPLFYDVALAGTLSAGGFKRFAIVADNVAASATNVLAFGIQFPDHQCLIYGREQQISPMVVEDVERALDEFKLGDAVVQWLD